MQVEAPFTTSGVYQVDVENGTVTDTRIYSPGTFRLDPNATAFEVAPSQGEAYTVAALFDRAARLVERFAVAAPLHATQHARSIQPETGHVAELVDNTCGWALTLVDECVTRITVQRLEAVRAITGISPPVGVKIRWQPTNNAKDKPTL